MSTPVIKQQIKVDGEKEFKNAIRGINSEYKTLQSEMKKVQSEFRDNANSIDALRAKNSVLVSSIEKQKEKVDKLRAALKNCQEQYPEDVRKQNQWKTSLNNAEAKLNDMNSELKKNEKYMSEASSSTTKTAKSIDQYGREVKQAEEKTSTFGDVLKANLTGTATISGIKSIISGVKQVGETVIDSGSSFEKAMSQEAALSGETGEKLNDLKEVAKEMGATTKFSATESAEGLQYMSLAGWNAKQQIAGLPGVVNLAAASGSDLAASSDILTDAITAFGDKAEDATRYADVLTKTQSSSNTTVSMLGESFKNVAATAGSYKYSLEATSAALGLMANAGIKGSEAGNKLSTIINRLATNTSGARDKLEELGVQFYDAAGNARPLQEVIPELQDAMKGMTDEQKSSISTTIAGQEAVRALNAMLGQGSEAYNDLYEKLVNANGAAENMAKTMSDNLSGDIDEFKSATEGLGITVYDVFSGTFRNVVQGATNEVDLLNKQISSGTGLGASMRGLAAAVDEASQDFIEFGADVADGAIKSLTWILNNRGAVGAAIKGIGTAVLTIKGGTEISKIITKLKDISANAGGAKSAIAGIGTALSAHPILTGATAVLGIATAIDMAGESAMAADTKFQKMINAVDEQNRAIETAVLDINQFTESRDEEILSTKSSSEANKKLADQLYALNNVENKSTSQKEQMKAIVDELNNSYPDLKLSIDSVTGALNKSQTETDAYIAKMKEQAEKEIYLEMWKATQKKIIEANSKLDDAEKAEEDARKAYASARSGLSETHDNSWAAPIVNSWGELKNAIGGADKEVEKSGDAYHKAIKNTNNLKEQIDVLNSDLKEYENKLGMSGNRVGSLAESQEKASTKTQEATTATITFGNKTKTVTDSAASEWEEIVGKYNTALDAAQKSIEGQIGLFDKWSEKSDLSAQQMLENLNSQINGMKDWQKNVKILAKKGISEGLLQELEAMGPQGAAYINELAKADEATIKKISDAWSKSQKEQNKMAKTVADEATGASKKFEKIPEAVESATAKAKKKAKSGGKETGENFNAFLQNAVTSGLSGALKVGGDIGNAVASGASNKSKSAKTSGAELAENLRKGILLGISGIVAAGLTLGGKAVNGIASGASGTKAEGSNLAQQLQNGIASGNSMVNTAGITLGSKAKTGVSNGLSGSNTLGSNFVSGLISGISGGFGGVIGTISSLASSAVAAFKRRLGINSPSKVMREMGGYVDEGLVSGIKRSSKNVSEEMKNLADTTANAYTTAMEIHSPSKRLHRAGVHTVDGLVNGINSRKSNAKATFTELSSQLIQSVQSQIEWMNNRGTPYSYASQMKLWAGVVRATKNGTKRNREALSEYYEACRNLEAKQISILQEKIEWMENKGTPYSLKSQAKLWKKAIAQTKAGGVKNKDALKEAQKNYLSVMAEIKTKQKEKLKEIEANYVTSTQNKIDWMNNKGTPYTLKAQADMWAKVIRQTKAGGVKNKDALKEAQKNYLSVMAEIKTSGNSLLSEYKSNVKSTISDLKNEIASTISSKQSSIMSGFDIFSKFTKNQSYTKDGLMKNLRSQVAGYSQWTKDLASLEKRGVSGTLLEELRNKGVTSAGEISALTRMSDAELAEYERLYKQKESIGKSEAIKETQKQVDELKKNANDQLKALSTEYKNGLKELGISTNKQAKAAGIYMSQGFADGILKGGRKVYEAIAIVTGKSVADTKKLLGIHSPSKVFQEIGEYTGQGMELGLYESTKNLASVVTNALPESVAPPTVQAAQATAGTCTINMVIDGMQFATAIVDKISLLQSNNLTLTAGGYAT